MPDMIQLKGNEGYIAQPEKPGTYPGVVIIQTQGGLNQQSKRVTEQVAAAGFITLTPDLHQVVDEDALLPDIQNAVDYLSQHLCVQPKPIGVMGFCTGGDLAIMMAIHGQHIGAVVAFYGGRQVLTETQAMQVSAPILGLYGELDSTIPLEIVRENQQKLRQAQKKVEFVIYPDAPHAFFDQEQTSYRRSSAEDAWNRALAWFRQHL